MQFDTLLFERRDGIVHVALNRPDRLNALNLEMITDLRAAAAAIDSDRDVRAVVLTASGRAFCSGADLMGDDLLGDPARSRGENIGTGLREHFNPMVESWYRLRVPVVVEAQIHTPDTDDNDDDDAAPRPPPLPPLRHRVAVVQPQAC